MSATAPPSDVSQGVSHQIQPCPPFFVPKGASVSGPHGVSTTFCKHDYMIAVWNTEDQLSRLVPAIRLSLLGHVHDWLPSFRDEHGRVDLMAVTVALLWRTIRADDPLLLEKLKQLVSLVTRMRCAVTVPDEYQHLQTVDALDLDVRPLYYATLVARAQTIAESSGADVQRVLETFGWAIDEHARIIMHTRIDAFAEAPSNAAHGDVWATAEQLMWMYSDMESVNLQPRLAMLELDRLVSAVADDGAFGTAASKVFTVARRMRAFTMRVVFPLPEQQKLADIPHVSGWWLPERLWVFPSVWKYD